MSLANMQKSWVSAALPPGWELYQAKFQSPFDSPLFSSTNLSSYIVERIRVSDISFFRKITICV